jgi:hypothetical protein
MKKRKPQPKASPQPSPKEREKGAAVYISNVVWGSA